MPDVILLENLVIDRQHRATRIAKDNFNTLILQGLNHHSCSGHLTRHDLFLRSAQWPLFNKKPPEVTRGRMGNLMCNRYRTPSLPVRFFDATTRITLIPASNCFVGETMAAMNGRQPQIDKKSVARGGFFELLLRIMRLLRNFSKDGPQNSASPSESSPEPWSSSLFKYPRRRHPTSAIEASGGDI